MLGYSLVRFPDEQLELGLKLSRYNWTTYYMPSDMISLSNLTGPHYSSLAAAIFP